MSQPATSLLPVVEWSPTSFRSFELGAGVTGSLPAGRTVRAALSRRNTFLRALRIPNVSGTEAERILRLMIPQHFPLAAGEFVFSYRLTSDVGSEGRLAVVAAARAEVVRALRSDLKERQLAVADIVPAAYGSMLLAKSLGLSDAAIVETGPEGYSIDLVAGGELRYSRVVPPETEAANLQEEVQRTFAMAGLAPSSVVALGGVQLAGSNSHAGRSTLEGLGSPEAAGLKVGLELPEVLEERQRKLVGNRARLSILLSIAALTLGLVVGLDRMDKAAAMRKEDAGLEAEIRKLKSSRDLAQTRVSSLAKTRQALERAFEPEQRASDVLALATSLAPKTIWLTGATFERGKPVLLRGVAMQSTDVAAYLETLTQQPRFRDVKLVFANDSTIDETKVNQFSISLHAVGNLPLSDPKSKRRTVTQ